MINTINQLEIRPDRVQIGLLQFAEQPRIEFYLNSFRNRQAVVNKISQMRLLGGSVLNVGAAVTYALENMFQASTGSRKSEGAHQVLVIVTGAPGEEQLSTLGDTLALAKILTFTVTSGQANADAWQRVAFTEELAYHSEDFSKLPEVADTIIDQDVAFLIDGTDSVRADFSYIRDFIISVIEPLDIGIDKVRISVVQHSERPAPNFYLNTYKTKEEVLRAINEMTPAGGRSLNTGSALKFMKDTILSEPYGSRSSLNVPQFLIVLAADRSVDNVKQPASDLKKEGVVPFGVGVKNADPEQIKTISQNPSLAFTVKEFSELSNIPNSINYYVALPQKELDKAIEQGKTSYASESILTLLSKTLTRYIVFLLDDSDNTKDGFSAIKHFVKNIVETLYVDENHDRVSVVQFADGPRVNFYLSTHKTKGDYIKAIDGMKHKGGRRVNIGAALQFVRHRVFTSSTGSRRLEGVPQILILLSSKPSSDNVRGPASSLKEHEIVSVASKYCR
uniref:VWFA domain-containing protein n=1 Tax=Oryzias sinensis TaxID=183150 RepID=A0A8C7ZR25_9TELE